MLSLSHNWSYVLLRGAYGRILMKILRDTLLEGRTRPVSTLVGWTCKTINHGFLAISENVRCSLEHNTCNGHRTLRLPTRL